jgi:hypothetical protein
MPHGVIVESLRCSCCCVDDLMLKTYPGKIGFLSLLSGVLPRTTYTCASDCTMPQTARNLVYSLTIELLTWNYRYGLRRCMVVHFLHCCRLVKTHQKEYIHLMW